MLPPNDQIKEALLAFFIDESVTRYSFEMVFTASGGSSSNGVLIKKTQNIPQSPPKEVRNWVRNFYEQTKDDPIDRFNKVSVTILDNKEYIADYVWDYDELKKDKLSWAKVLPQWVNDRIISLLFSAGYGTEKNWQQGVFTFTVRNGTLLFDGVIYNSDIVTTVDVTLPEYLVEGIVEHYQLTNEGVLKDQWQPWNQMVIRSPHNDLDLGKDVTYTNAAVGKRGSIG